MRDKTNIIFGGGQSRGLSHQTVIEASFMLQKGKSVAFLGCKSPEDVARRIKDLIQCDVCYLPIKSNQGKVLGYGFRAVPEASVTE